MYLKGTISNIITSRGYRKQPTDSKGIVLPNGKKNGEAA